MTDTNPPTDNPPYRRPGTPLTRSTDDTVLGGLSGGRGRYFGLDPVGFRLAFGVLTAASPMMARELGARSNSVRDVRRTVRQAMWASVATPSRKS